VARFDVEWTLTVEGSRAGTLAGALAPDTKGEHARLARDGDRLVVRGEGEPGACLHALDDVLASLTGALEALDAEPAGHEDEADA